MALFSKKNLNNYDIINICTEELINSNIVYKDITYLKGALSIIGEYNKNQINLDWWRAWEPVYNLSIELKGYTYSTINLIRLIMDKDMFFRMNDYIIRCYLKNKYEI